LANQLPEGIRAIAEALGGFLLRAIVDEGGAERFVLPLVGGGGFGEEAAAECVIHNGSPRNVSPLFCGSCHSSIVKPGAAAKRGRPKSAETAEKMGQEALDCGTATDEGGHLGSRKGESVERMTSHRQGSG
jgi:hypothetical protein